MIGGSSLTVQIEDFSKTNFGLSNCKLYLPDKMSLDKFEGLTNRMLSSENLQALQSIRNNRNLIDQNLLAESHKFESLDVPSVKSKISKLESTEEIDARVKKFNDLDEQLKKFVRNGKKQFKETDKHCDVHRCVNPTEFSVCLNEFMEKELPVVDVESVLKGDEVLMQQHASNVEKVNKVMEAVKECNYKKIDMPAAELVNGATTFLHETVSDINYLNESNTMYNGLKGDAPVNPYAEEFKDLHDNLYIQ